MNEDSKFPDWCKIGIIVHIKEVNPIFPGRFGVISGIDSRGYIDLNIIGGKGQKATIQIENLEKEEA